MPLIFFSGVDGSGKSTHAKLLSVYIKRKGVKVVLAWMRWFAFLSYTVLVLCKFLGLTRRSRFSSHPLRLYWIYKPIALIWFNLFLFDYAIYVLIKLISTRGRIVIADRFMLDIFIDVAYDTHLNPIKHVVGRFFLLLFYRLMKKGLIKGFVMLVDEHTVFRRRQDVPGRAYVSFRISMYTKFAVWLGIPIINGRNDITGNFLRIMRLLGLDKV